MEIKINGEPLEYSLEQEDSLPEILDAIDSWLSSSRHIITELRINGTLYTPEDRGTWGTIPLSTVDLLEIEASTAFQLRVNNLETVIQFLSLLSKSVENDDEAGKKELMAEYPYVQKSLSDLLAAPGYRGNEPISQQLDLILQKSGLSSDGWDSSMKTAVLTACNQVIMLLQERLREIEDPLNELFSSKEVITKSLEDTAEVSVLLQTGKDKEAMTRVLSFLDLSQKILRCLSYLINKGIIDAKTPVHGETSLEDYYSELNKVMQELIEAFEAKDSILIGDFLEYEISPRIHTLLESLHSLSTEE